MNNFQFYKISDNNSVAQSVQIYEFGKNSLWLSIVHNKKWNRYSLDITRKFTNTKDGKTKEGSCSIYLNLTAAKDQLQFAYQLAKNLQDNQGVEIYNIFCLISEICYTFPHRSGASYRKRLGRWSARRHCRSRRHRNLKYRQLCHGLMRTQSRWSKSARIWESRRWSWTPLCYIFRPSFKQTSCECRTRDHAKPPPD